MYQKGNHMSESNSIVIPSFDKTSRAIFNGASKVLKANERFGELVCAEMNKFIDAVRLALPGKVDQAACKAMQKTIMDSEIVKESTKETIVKRKTWVENAQGAQRALYFGIPFTTDLKNNPDYVLPWGKKSTPAEQKAGTVTTTTRAELDKTISKALAQARLIGLAEFAADMLDLALERLDGFKETVLDK
jgi:hypothetical protein